MQTLRVMTRMRRSSQVLIVMAPLTEANLASFAHVSAACSVLCILVTASVTGHEVASSMIAISVPAYMCALIGALHAAFSSPSLLFPVSSFSFCVCRSACVCV
jgi:hypothetical protein